MGSQPKKTSRLFIILGVALTLISMIGVYFIANSASNSGSSGTVQVLVANQAIPPHTTFSNSTDTTTWLTLTTYPSGSVPQGAFTSYQAFDTQMYAGGVNQSTSFPIEAKQFVLASMFTNLHSQTQVTSAYVLPKDRVAVAFQVSEVNSSAGSVSAGDYIDLVGSYLPTGGGSGGASEQPAPAYAGQTQMILQHAHVISIGQISPNTDSGATAGSSTPTSGGANEEIVLAMRPQDALMLQHLKDFGASWDLSVMLVANGSKSYFPTTPVMSNWYWSKLTNNFKHVTLPNTTH